MELRFSGKKFITIEVNFKNKIQISMIRFYKPKGDIMSVRNILISSDDFEYPIFAGTFEPEK